jgi:hypothetical protein
MGSSKKDNRVKYIASTALDVSVLDIIKLIISLDFVFYKNNASYRKPKFEQTHAINLHNFYVPRFSGLFLCTY